MKLTRRELLCFAPSLGALGLLACKRERALPASCIDTTGLDTEAVQARSALAYADRAEMPGKACLKCVQYTDSAAEGACGGCKLLRGPIHPNGTCKAFAAKA